MSRRKKYFTGYEMGVEERDAFLEQLQALGQWFGRREKEYLDRERIQKIEYKLMEAMIERGIDTEMGLARVVQQTQGNVSKLLKRLNNEGWLRLGRKGKQQTVEVTEAGREIFARGKRERETMVFCWLHRVAPGERKRVLAWLRKLNELGEAWEYDLDFEAARRGAEAPETDHPRRRGPIGAKKLGGAARVEVTAN